MNKTMKQSTLHRSNDKKGSAISGKFSGQEAYSVQSAPVNSHVKELLSKAPQEPQTGYMVVQISDELAKQAEQKKPVAKAEESRVMFAKYRASK
jgi:hypothetical protein